MEAQVMIPMVAPIVNAIVHLAKRSPALQDRKGWLPAVSIVVGVVVTAAAAAAFPLGLPIAQVIGQVVLRGSVAGLAASGLYDLGVDTATVGRLLGRLAGGLTEREEQ